MKVEWPKCEWCGSDDHIWACPVCGHWSCIECMKRTGPDSCVHKMYANPEHSKDWHESKSK